VNQPIYFNEFDSYPADWLRNLFPRATVDARSIVDLQPSDVSGYDRAHFFAGIGGWEYALGLAGWPNDRDVWTGSCPCQPFSAAGKGKGEADERHLWPEFRRLIAECRPPVVFGEQVASRLGREWLAGVRADLEALGYAVGAADLCAAGVGAPHLRQRLYWVAHTSSARAWGDTGAAPGAEAGLCRAGDTDGIDRGHPSLTGGSTGWGDAWLQCLDGKARRVEPGVFPLAHGVPGRLGRLRAYGNAIVPQAAAAFVRAYMEATGMVAEAERGGVTVEAPANAAGWATPDAACMNVGADLDNHLARLARLKEKHGNGNGAGMPLGVQAQLAGELHD
jgi:DNA (cytosine-5)-methyltransferase 1